MNAKIAENIDLNMAAVADFCLRWHISKMALFGLDIQRLRGDQGAVGG